MVVKNPENSRLLLNTGYASDMSMSTQMHFDNPIWENARKALEAVSPKKTPNAQHEKVENGGMAGGNQNMSPQEMYYQQLNNYKQNQGQFNGMPPRPPFFGMPGNNAPPGYGMPPQQQFGSNGRFRGPPPGFGQDQTGPDPRGFNQGYMPQRPQHFQPRNNMQQHPGAGGIRFNIPKRNKMQQHQQQQQQQQNGEMNSYNGPPVNPPNFGKNPRYMGPRGPRPPMMNNNNQQKPNNMSEQPQRNDSLQSLDKSNAEAGMADWPPTLKNWVQRAFSSVTKERKDQMESILKNKLTEAFTTGSAFTTDWDNEPIPFQTVPQQQQQQQPDTPGKKRSRWGDPSSAAGEMKNSPVTPAQGTPGMRGQRGGFLRGRGMQNMQNRRGREPMPRFGGAPSRRSYSRSRSRSYSRSSSSRSRSRSRSPDRRRRRLTSPSRRSPGRSRRRYRSRSRSRSRSSSRSSRSSGRDYYSLETKQRGRGRGARARGRGKDNSRGRGRGKNNKNNSNGFEQESQNEFPSGKKQKGKNQKNKTPKGKVKGAIFKLENSEQSAEKLMKRAARFGDQLDQNKPRSRLNLSTTSFASVTVQDSDEESNMDWSNYHITGTCQDLEKQYLRMSGPPDASKIRPVEVLKRSLEMVKEDWRTKMDYRYACEQMKTIRQDLTVQGVRDEFSVKVYETHARIAMEKGDHEEFNQCQSQLKNLYKEGLPGNRLEFTAYRLLYYMYTNNLGDINLALTDLSKEDRTDECVAHALQVRSAWALSNYTRFFRLYLNAPKMSGYLMDKFVLRIRKAALKSAIKAYRPNLPIDFIVPRLGFSDRDECIAFLNEMNVTLTADSTKLDCKASMAVVNSI